MEKKRKIFLIADIILIVITVGFIWWRSLLTQAESAAESEQVYDTMQGFLDYIFGAGVITEGILRKIAHFSEFALLSLELNAAFSILKYQRNLGFITVLFSGLFVAFTDETLQLFSGRGAGVSDVALDFSGIVFITVIFIIIYAARKKKKNN